MTRALERLLLHLDFEDAVVIDGSGDNGGDLLGIDREGKKWVFQAKWKKHSAVDTAAIKEVVEAQVRYRADKVAVVTNTRYARSAVALKDELARVGTHVYLWTGQTLQKLYDAIATERLARRELRPYQSTAFEKLISDLSSTGRALLFLATGLGKTVVGGEVLAWYLSRKPDAKILAVAHMKELVEQLERALWQHIPKDVRTQLLTGDHRPDDLRGITCATVESALHHVKSGYRPDLVMVDEAHHVGADGNYSRLLDAVSSAAQFGVTATPWRGDSFDLSSRFGPTSYALGIEEGMRLGYLAEVRYRLFADNIDWDFIRQNSKYDYSLKDLNAKLFLPQRDEAIRDELINTWARTKNPRAIVFCRTVAHAERMASLLGQVSQWRGAQAIHAQLPSRERKERLLNFRSGEVPILTAVDILNEGVDVPDVNILCFARVTHSRRIFVQQLGRGLRLRPGKEHVEVLDFVSDLRRVAAVLRMRQKVTETDPETLHIPAARNQFEFSDQNAGDFLTEWLRDAADLETRTDDSRLSFPDPNYVE
nr:DEAD/DEAH box helicase family protein [Saccharopolyspora hordei]